MTEHGMEVIVRDSKADYANTTMWYNLSTVKYILLIRKG